MKAGWVNISLFVIWRFTSLQQYYLIWQVQGELFVAFLKVLPLQFQEASSIENQ